jgi:predicted transcriptional regulator
VGTLRQTPNFRNCPTQAKTGLEWIARRLCLANRRKRGYTFGMKTAVSIPNELFAMAERLARRSRKSRSRLFSDALREYVARRSPDKITDAMDQAVAEIGESSDPFVAAASRRRLEQSEW